MAKIHEHARELELSRALARLLQILPYGVVLSMISSFRELTGKSDKKINAGENDELEIDTEKRLIKKSNDKRRLDVFLPFGFDDIREIVFETKLGDENYEQVEGYAEARKSALVVSLAKRIGKSATRPHPRIARMTWEEFFWGMFSLLGNDAQTRLVRTEEGGGQFDFVPNYPSRSIGAVAEEYLEEFLRSIRAKGLVSIISGNRVLAVTGANATRTTTKYNLDGWGHWNPDFSYVCVVHQKKLQYIGKVVERFDEVVISNGKIVDRQPLYPNMTDEIEKNIVEAWGRDSKDNILLLEKIDPASDPQWKGIEIGDVFQRKGAMTQSHRYFDSPTAFIASFQRSGRQTE